jgi:hypothetical protein
MNVEFQVKVHFFRFNDPCQFCPQSMRIGIKECICIYYLGYIIGSDLIVLFSLWSLERQNVVLILGRNMI